MYRRATKRIAKIKNINIIEQKLKQSLITKKDVFQQVTLKVYKIGINNSFTKQVVFKGNILDTLDWCSEKQIQLKSTFDGYLNNIRNNSDRSSILKFTKNLIEKINSSNLYSDKCFRMVKKFIKDFSIKDPQLKLKDSQMKDYIDGKNGIKKQIQLYRKLVTSERVNVLTSLYQYYVSNDKKQNYSLGISGIQKAIDQDQILKIKLKKSGYVKIKPTKVKTQKWVLFGQQLDQNNQPIQKVIICCSDIDKQ